jgi:hypothetical protein
VPASCLLRKQNEKIEPPRNGVICLSQLREVLDLLFFWGLCTDYLTVRGRSPSRCSVSLISCCKRATTVARCSFAIFLSALPNLTPRTSQFGSRRDSGILGWTTTPMKFSQPGTAFTASAIASSISAAVFEVQWSLGHHVFLGG